MAQTSEAAEAEIMDNLSMMAADGTRGLFLAGKVKKSRPVVSEKTGEKTYKVDVISGEGESMTLNFPGTATVPGVGLTAAFQLANVREYMNRVSADCVAFK